MNKVRDLLRSTSCHNIIMSDKDCGDPVAKSQKMSSALDQLKQYTTVVADTGDFEGKWACPARGLCRSSSLGALN